jgi:glycosyltransferase involved in cell wall biosynthesis
MPEVSICLTTYNRAHTLAATIDSILSQSFHDFELIISDDNSADHTKELCEGYQSRDARVKYYRNGHNLKMPGNLNAAIGRCSGKYIANLHDGDIYDAQLIQKWKQALDKNPEALFVFNGYYIEDGKGNRTTYLHPGFSELNEGKLLMDYYIETFSSAPWGTVMARKDAYDRYGLFDASYGFISDVEMWLRLGLHGKVAYIGEPLITLTPREGDHPYFHPHWKVIQNIFKIMSRYYHAYGYPAAGIAQINRRIRKRIWYKLILLVRHHRMDRLSEGLQLFRRSPFLSFRLTGLLAFVFKSPVTDASQQSFWDDIMIPENKNEAVLTA